MAVKFMKSIVLGASLATALAPTAFAKEWKTVAIAMDGAYAPWNFTDSSGHLLGARCRGLRVASALRPGGLDFGSASAAFSRRCARSPCPWGGCPNLKKRRARFARI
jgi:ABC-type amino acid transport substrate-binding protein